MRIFFMAALVLLAPTCLQGQGLYIDPILPDAQIGIPYSARIGVSSEANCKLNGTDTPPPGLALTGSTCTITGIPTAAGTYRFAIWAAIGSTPPTSMANADDCGKAGRDGHADDRAGYACGRRSGEELQRTIHGQWRNGAV